MSPLLINLNVSKVISHLEMMLQIIKSYLVIAFSEVSAEGCCLLVRQTAAQTLQGSLKLVDIYGVDSLDTHPLKNLARIEFFLVNEVDDFGQQGMRVKLQHFGPLLN